MLTFIDSDFCTTDAKNLIIQLLEFILSGNAGFITAKNFAFAKFLVFPEFALAGCAFDR